MIIYKNNTADRTPDKRTPPKGGVCPSVCPFCQFGLSGGQSGHCPDVKEGKMSLKERRSCDL